MPKDQWVAVQCRLCGAPLWMLGADLAPYYVSAVRLRAADTVVVLDFPL